MEVKLLKYLPILMLVLFACNSEQEEETGEKESTSVLDGKALAESYCASCHMYTEPSLLDKKTWSEGILPAMGPRFGIFEHNGVKYPSDKGKPNTEGIYPSKPTISADEWQAILDYYENEAPENMAGQNKSNPYNMNFDQFEVNTIASNNVAPVISMLRIVKEGGFFIFDANSNVLAKMDTKGNATSIIKMQNPLVNLIEYKNKYLATSIGSILPSDIWAGELSVLSTNNGAISPSQKIIGGLERPVMTRVGDVNGDKIEDFVVCGYGHNKGVFFWVNGKDKTRNVIRAVPGAISTTLVDYDKDGDLDIFTLFAQSDEKILYFENDGKGNFAEKEILRFIPVQGSSSMQVVDMNKDGNLDILYTCGDNADYSMVLKNYHGVYVFTGDGTGNFKKSFFYPMNGAFKARAADFDNDGDMDIAAISFFADYLSQPYEGFLYFKQKANLDFVVQATDKSYKGRWLTMDVGDVDLDGDEDIILGNFSMGPSNVPDQIKNTWMNGPAAMVLINLQSIK